MLTCMPRSRQSGSDNDRDQSPDTGEMQLKFSDKVPPVHPNTKHFSSKRFASQVCVYVILTYSVEKTSTLQSRLNFKNRESLKLEKKKLLEVFNLSCNIFRSIFWNSGSATVVMKLLVCFDNSLDFVLW